VVRARRVVVAAGAYHSPALLRRGGQYLLDHACLALNLYGKDGLLAELAEKEWNPTNRRRAGRGSSRCDDGPYDIHVFIVAGECLSVRVRALESATTYARPNSAACRPDRGTTRRVRQAQILPRSCLSQSSS